MPNLMKSRLFSTFDPDSERNKQFRSDLRFVLGLSEDQRNSLLAAYPTYIEARDDSVQERLLRDAASSAGLADIAAQHFNDFVTFLLRQLDDDQIASDEPADWATDLLSLELVKNEETSAFTKLAASVRDSLAPALHRRARERAAERGVLPSLSGIGTTVELRGVMRRSYRWGTPIENYAPQVEAVVPVVSVLLKLDSGQPDSIGFQVSVPLLERLIDSLIAARKSAEALANRLTHPGS